MIISHRVRFIYIQFLIIIVCFMISYELNMFLAVRLNKGLTICMVKLYIIIISFFFRLLIPSTAKKIFKLLKKLV
jgi:hypothetical protein